MDCAFYDMLFVCTKRFFCGHVTINVTLTKHRSDIESETDIANKFGMFDVMLIIQFLLIVRDTCVKSMMSIVVDTATLPAVYRQIIPVSVFKALTSLVVIRLVFPVLFYC